MNHTSLVVCAVTEENAMFGTRLSCCIKEVGVSGLVRKEFMLVQVQVLLEKFVTQAG